MEEDVLALGMNFWTPCDLFKGKSFHPVLADVEGRQARVVSLNTWGGGLNSRLRKSLWLYWVGSLWFGLDMFVKGNCNRNQRGSQRRELIKAWNLPLKFQLQLLRDRFSQAVSKRKRQKSADLSKYLWENLLLGNLLCTYASKRLILDRLPGNIAELFLQTSTVLRGDKCCAQSIAKS